MSTLATAPADRPPEVRRVASIDWLRGAVMVLMALDHARDYFGDFRVDPVDLAATTPALFATRWVTHFCAPTFVLLAGVAAWLYGAKPGRTRRSLARFLLSRGLWLIVLEFTVVYFGWTFTFTLGLWFLQVIAAIGFAMVVLAGLVFLPAAVVGAVGAAIVAGHDALGPLAPGDFGAASPLWRLLHEGSMQDGVPLALGGPAVLVVYPLLPWVGVLALGYGFGALWTALGTGRRRGCIALGLLGIAAFVAIRAANGYGNAAPWSVQAEPVGTLMSFLNCQKYPPSLAFLLMTLGPAVLALGLLERAPGPVGRALVTLGRVPLFFYGLHIYALHAASMLFYRLAYGEWFSSMADVIRAWRPGGPPVPAWYGHPVWLVWLAWLVVVVAIYPVCAWYARRKARGRSPLWSYL